LIPNKQLV